MLAQQLRESSSLFDSLDAMRHWRALLLLAASFVAALALWALGGRLLGATGWWVLLCLCAVVGGVLLMWGGNAAGILMMDEVAGQPSRSVGLALRASLGATQQLVLVLLALALFYLIGLLALAVMLLICSVPVLGPWLYAVVFPVAAVASGIALFVLPALVFPLCVPAIWRGLDASTSLAQLWGVVKQRLPLVLTWMLVLACIASVVWTVLLAVLLLGFSMTSGVSATVLGAQGLWSAGVFAAGRAAGGTEMAAYAHSAAMGSATLFAAACAVPSLVAMRGACIVYRRALFGLNTAHEVQALNHALAEAKNRAWELGAPAPALQKPPASSHSPTSSPGFSSAQAEGGERIRSAWAPTPLAASSAVASSWPFSETAATPAAVVPPPPPAPPFQLPPARPQPAAVTPLDVDLEVPFAASSPYSSSFAAAAAAPMPCPVCSGTTEATDFFCGHCGHALR
jgi:hypothetical protein